MRALLRLLLLGLLIAFLVHAVRRALAAGREHAGRGRRPDGGGGDGGDGGGGGGSLPPERLVCGACGHEFNPEQSGWICPKCGK
jgi:rubrerythrin